MRLSMEKMRRLLTWACAVVWLWAGAQFNGRTMAAEIAANFTLPNHKGGPDIHLYDYAGKIILLEFFYWWCPHCQAATPQIRTNIHQYYEDRGGSPGGYPIVEIYINLETDPGGLGPTDAFIQQHGLDIVADDFVYDVFFGLGGSGTPHLVLINGVTNTLTHQPWEILFSESGYIPATTIPRLRQKINSVNYEGAKPTVTLTSPLANARLTNGVITLRGTARDNFRLGKVEYQLGEEPFEIADGTTNWSASLNLVPGTNTVRVKSIDVFENESAVVTRNFILLAPLTVATNGFGRVSPNLNGKFLDVGKKYFMTAIPGFNQVFSNWTGGEVITNAPLLSFIMQPGLMLNANFVPNPFLPVKGMFNGLFYDTNGILHESSGFFTLTLAVGGTYSASLQLGGKRHAFTGKFDLDGKSLKSVPRLGTNALTVDLQLDLAGGSERITGSVSDNNWTAQLWADRAQFHAVTNKATNFVGKYTFLIPGGSDAAVGPGGDGFGTVTINSAGLVTMTGTLADNTAISQRVPLSKNGHWPLYVQLYGGKGSILSWVGFTNPPLDGFNGPLSWIKPSGLPLSLKKYYGMGFTNDTSINGSYYLPPVGLTNRVLNFTNGIVSLQNGNLTQPITNSVVLQPNNKVVNQTNISPNKLLLTIVPSSGLFSGTVVVPGTNKIIAFKGVLQQTQNFGAGFFLGTNQSGRVFFGPQP